MTRLRSIRKSLRLSWTVCIFLALLMAITPVFRIGPGPRAEASTIQADNPPIEILNSEGNESVPSPAITDIQESNVTAVSAVITWKTDILANSVVNYGTTTSLGANSSDDLSVTDHLIMLSDLSAETTYYYEVQSTTIANMTAADSNGGLYYAFTTAPIPTPTPEQTSTPSPTSSPTPEPTSTPSPTPSPTPEPTSTQEQKTTPSPTPLPSPSQTPGPDAIPPVITKVQATGFTETSVTITWTTDEPADSVVNYWATTIDKDTYEKPERSIPTAQTAMPTPIKSSDLAGANPYGSVSDSSLVTKHSVVLTSINPETEYYYEVQSTDIANNTTIDDNGGRYYNFRTLEPGGKYRISVLAHTGNETILKSGNERITLRIPQGAVSERLQVELTEYEIKPSRTTGVLAHFELDAFAADREDARVTRFNKGLELTIQFDPEDLRGFNTNSIRLRFFDEELDKWVYEPSARFDPETMTLSATITHFSEWEPLADPSIAGPGRILATDVGLHTGSATFNYPLEVPPGVGGFQPDLALYYYSLIADEMNSKKDVGSWVGVGWYLGMGSISYNPLDDRYFLRSSDGLSYEIIQDPDGTYHTVPDMFYDITRNGPDWTVYDRDGICYRFGAISTSRQYYYDSVEEDDVYYRSDLCSVYDTYGHGIHITYVQDICGSPDMQGYPDHVRSAYVDTITYTGKYGGDVEVVFIATHDVENEVIGDIEWGPVRNDNPVDSACGLPPVIENRKLERIEIYSNGLLFKEYEFETSTTPSYYYGGEDELRAGTHTLQSITEYDGNGQALPAIYFDYTNYFPKYGESPVVFILHPYLRSICNDYGGNATFSYQTTPPWSSDPPEGERSAIIVTQKTIDAGLSGNPVQTTTYDYLSEPAFTTPCGTSNRAYRGFSKVTETDAEGNYIEHFYHTSGSAREDCLTGTEYRTRWYDSSGTLLKMNEQTWNYLYTSEGSANQPCRSYYRYLEGNSTTTTSPSLAGHWTLDDPYETVLDSSIHGNHGHLGSDQDSSGDEHDPGSTDGMIGSALVFDGNDYITCDHSATLTPDGPFGVEAWIKLGNITGDKVILSKAHADNVNDRTFEFKTTGDDLELVVYDDGADNAIGRRATDQFTAGTWYHVIGTYNGGTDNNSVKLFVNGVQEDDQDSGWGTFTAIGSSTIDLMIGCTYASSAHTGFFEGSLDDIHIYDRKIWSPEIEEFYNVGSTNNFPNTPSNPSPLDEAGNVTASADISWSGGDPDTGDTVTYDVYFSTNSPPFALVSSYQSATSYDPGTLDYSTTYYWQVVATDNHGYFSTSPIWQFSTETDPTPPPGNITLHSTADARIAAQFPTTNYGNLTSIGIQAYNSAGRQRSLIQFDFSSIPEGSTIDSATFSAYYYSYYNPSYNPAGRTYYLYRNTDSWTETGVNWDNQPGFTTSQGASVTMPGSYGWVNWDVTDITQSWVDGMPNCGFVMKDGWETQGVNRVALFYSKEYAGTSYAPRLVVEYTPPGPTPQPIAHWTLDEGSGPAAYDSTSNNNDGALNDDPSWTTGISGNALRFDGSDQIEVPDSQSLDQPHVTGELTIEAWVNKYSDLTYLNHVQMKWGCYWLEITQDQKLKAGVWDCGDLTGDSVLGNNSWYHVAVTYDGSYMKLYVNGQLDNSDYCPGNISEDTWSLHIGYTWYDDAAFPGYIDDVRVYCHALTGTEIFDQYKSTLDHYESVIPRAARVNDRAKTTLTEYEYDEYGNVITEFIRGDISTTEDDSTIHRVFHPNESDWILNKVARERIYAGIIQDDTGTGVEKETRYYYDGRSTWDTLPGEHGQLTRTESKVDNDPEEYISTYSTYDSHGNVITHTDGNGIVTTITYDSSGAFPATITYPEVNGLAMTKSYTWDAATGNPLTETDVNGEVTSYIYDSFGRLIKIVRPGDTMDSPTREYSYDTFGDGPGYQYLESRYKTSEGEYFWTREYFDGTGRIVQTQAKGEGNETIITSTTEYDNRGLISREYVPQIYGYPTSEYITPDSSWKYGSFQYDALDREIVTTGANGATVKHNYDTSWQVVTTNPLGVDKRDSYDAFQQLVQVVEEDDSGADYATTTYEYTTLGNLALITDAHNNTTITQYDMLQRKTSTTNPDLGTWTYEYDNNGNTINQKDNKGQTITLSYDVLDRLTGKTYPAGSNTTDVCYTYDVDPPIPTPTPTPTPANVTLYSVADATIAAQSPTTNYGTSNSVNVQSYYADVRQRNLTQFDISGIPEGSTINSATFSAYYYGPSSPTYNPAERVYYLCRNTDSWTEPEVNWNNKPGFTASQMASATMPGTYYPIWQEFGWVNWDVTDIAQSWVDGTPNYGFVMMDSNEFSGQGRYALFYSKEYTGTSYAPRLVVNYTPPAPNHSYGRRTGMTDAVGTTAFIYDGRGRLIQETRTIDGGNYTTSITYNSADQMKTITYPTGEVITLDYNDSCLPYSLSSDVEGNIVNSTIYNQLGHVSQINLNNGVTTDFSYWGLDHGSEQYGRLYNIKVSKGVEDLLDIRHTWDDAGNLVNRYDAVADETESFGYDFLDRLTSASGAYTMSYTYDEIGNILSKNGTTYTYSQTKPHAVTSVGDMQYAYDANGNMITRNDQVITWDAENRPIQITEGGNVSSYVYDGDGYRIKKTEGNETVIYVNPLYEKNLTTGEATLYYCLAGKTVALKKGTDLEYIHQDHLTGTALTTDENGDVVSTVKYYPFGLTRSSTGTLATDMMFTGQRLDGTGLYFYNGRMYDPVIVRFISPDTIVPDLANPQALNLYSYCVNNPLKYVDPSGHIFWLIPVLGALALLAALWFFVPGAQPWVAGLAGLAVGCFLIAGPAGLGLTILLWSSPIGLGSFWLAIVALDLSPTVLASLPAIFLAGLGTLLEAIPILLAAPVP